MSASSVLKILLPERENNEKIYESFNNLLSSLESIHWIKTYIYWEFSLIKELGFEINLSKYINGDKIYKESININNKSFKVPKILKNKDTNTKFPNEEVKNALIFNKNLLIENLLSPNKLKLPFFRNILENYF